MLKRFQVTLFAILFVLALSAPCGAAELVTNGGFETSNFSNWTVTNAPSGSLIAVNTVDPHTGTYAAAFGAVGTQDDSISQTLATVAGQSYTFSFWLAHPTGRSINDFSALWNGTPVLSLTNSLLFAYTQYSFTEIAGSLPTVITFSGLEQPAYFYLDDVSVTGPQSVPEPASLLLMGFGLLGLAGVRRMMRGMQFKTNMMEGTMKTHLCLVVMICGLLLVAAPAMAQAPLPGIQIFDNDANAPGISVTTFPSFTGTPVITQETTSLPGSVIWNFTYTNFARTTVDSFSYNIFEQAGGTPALLSDTLLITLRPSPVAGTAIGHLEFFSGPLNDAPLLNALPNAISITETGALQDILLITPSLRSDFSVLQFQSDLDNPTTVPEPASLLLFGFGLVGLAWVRRREEFK